MYFDVRENDGKIANWMVEFAGISGLSKAGLKNKNDLSVGATYTLVVNPDRRGRRAGIVNTMTFPNGRVFKISSGAPDAQ